MSIEYRPAQIVEVDEGSAGQRLDNFLSSRLKGLPRNRIYRIVRKGEVRVNGGRAKPSRRVTQGDRVRIPPVRIGFDDRMPASPEMLALVLQAVVFESSDYLILDKPAGIAVHSGSGIHHGVIEVLRQGRPEAPFLELGHRLDRATSGCLLIAKTRQALLAFQDALQNSAVEKRYLLLVKGVVERDQQDVTLRLSRVATAGEERMVRVAQDGKEAVSSFTVVTRYAKTTLLSAQILTGRTHQIRVHASAIGHPIAGDEKYGDRQFNRETKRQGLARLFLHASALQFGDQSVLDEVAVGVPLPQALQQFLEQLNSATN